VDVSFILHLGEEQLGLALLTRFSFMLRFFCGILLFQRWHNIKQAISWSSLKDFSKKQLTEELLHKKTCP
jgi:hypothetical protein